jgi:hypothetical protein
MERPTVSNWRKASYSGGNGGNCVEVGDQANGVVVRDSKLTMSPVIRFTPEAWRALVTKVKAS